MGKFLELISENGWEYVVRKNTLGVAIVCVYNKDNKKYLVIEQYRIPVKKRLIEFPAGLIEAKETSIDTAIRELKEEIGLICSPNRLIDLGQVYSSAGLANEKAYLYGLVIDNNTNFVEPQLDIMELKNNLKQLWVTEDTLINAEAAKVLAILLRFKEKYLKYAGIN
jgi:ADP-ribose pyrophosphatase